jgi:penicillin V acylase-like amidase (Ntn superfamily)
MKLKLNVYSTLVALIIGAMSIQEVTACTRILWNDNKLSAVVSRTMDWPQTTDPVLVLFPRGMKRDGGLLGGLKVVKENPLQWTSKYASLVTTIYGVGTADGLNEEGLGAHILFFKPADFGRRDLSKPGLNAALWAQYVLDNAATVKEALDLLSKVQVTLTEARGTKTTVHLAIEDASGDSAIIEYLAGVPTIHHGARFTILTNDPSYDQQVALLKKLDFSKPSSDMPLPGNVSSTDRFQRASYYLPLLPEPKTEAEAVAGILGIARNVSVPFGAPYKNFGVYNTEYRTVADLTNKRYFFELTTTPNVVWVDMNKFNLSKNASVMSLTPGDMALSGEVSGKFLKAKQIPF